jgi:hypothetical protein
MEQLLCNRANEASNALAVIDCNPSNNLLPTWSNNDTDRLFRTQAFLEQVRRQNVGFGSSAPDIQLHAMLGDLSTRFVMTTNNLAGKVSQFNILPIEPWAFQSNQMYEEYDFCDLLISQTSH